ncbi:hypothetical protein SSX86_016786 [Deinandra increscens subsp. villosa]|uniref:Gag protein n=1 Tax=Deinandra increscens subsp. villosa TaxID=3103831 RepID=A0AAP0D2V7_9ASTR
MATESTIISVTAPTHFPIKLTNQNYPVWSRHIRSTLIGLGIDDYLTGTVTTPPKTVTTDGKSIVNPKYTSWFRQDQVIFSALLGSYTDEIQPIIASATTAHEAWTRLADSYASTCRSRIVSLKSKLAKNPKGDHSVTTFLNDMRAIADDLALAQSPIPDEDLVVYILTQLGDEFNPITAALKVRETPIKYPELYDKLVDFERHLKDSAPPPSPILDTANVAQRLSRPAGNRRPNTNFRPTNSPGPNPPNYSSGPSYNRPTPQKHSGSTGSPRTNLFCKFCNFSGHEVQECRKFARFVKENNLSSSLGSVQPVANHVTSSSGQPL